jgi:hypothetical protein
VPECLGPKFDGHPGQRVADGQRILRATGDIFLGWADDAESGRDFYVRQLKNRRLQSFGELVEENAFEDYARLCAKALACAHARSADPAVIAGYMGEDDTFDDALASFAMVYAARTQEDYDWLVKAARSRRSGTGETALIGLSFPKIISHLMVMQRGQHRDGDNDTRPLHRSTQGASLSSDK